MLEDEAYGHVTARYYDAVYQKLREGCGDVEFYRDLARQACGPVLELGCGTGRTLLPIAKDGFPCTGLDVSPRMLETLRRKEFPPTLRLVCDPMQQFDLPDIRFSLIFAAFRVFQHLYTLEDQLACLACVKHHLAPGGIFAFDVFNPDPERIGKEHEDEVEEARFETGGEQIARYTSVDRDPETQVMNCHMRYERSQDGRVFDSEVAEVRMRWFYREELEKLMARAGFEGVEFYGDFDRQPFTDDSRNIIVVARS